MGARRHAAAPAPLFTPPTQWPSPSLRSLGTAALLASLCILPTANLGHALALYQSLEGKGLAMLEGCQLQGRWTGAPVLALSSCMALFGVTGTCLVLSSEARVQLGSECEARLKLQARAGAMSGVTSNGGRGRKERRATKNAERLAGERGAGAQAEREA